MTLTRLQHLFTVGSLFFVGFNLGGKRREKEGKGDAFIYLRQIHGQGSYRLPSRPAAMRAVLFSSPILPRRSRQMLLERSLKMRLVSKPRFQRHIRNQLPAP